MVLTFDDCGCVSPDAGGRRLLRAAAHSADPPPQNNRGEDAGRTSSGSSVTLVAAVAQVVRRLSCPTPAATEMYVQSMALVGARAEAGTLSRHLGSCVSVAKSCPPGTR